MAGEEVKKMNKVAVWVLSGVLLGGCTSQSITWQEANQVEFAQSTVELQSHLWLNMMPTIGEVQDSTLHGALYLESDTILPAELNVERVSIRQGDQSWDIAGDLLELRTHNRNKWEVAFIWQLQLDPEQTVDVALELNIDQQVEWLVEKNVKIQKVY